MLHSILATIAIAALAAHAAPTTLLTRQNGPFSGPNQVTTHHIIPVAGGSVVEDCTITLTPIVVNGQDLVREERACVNTFVPTGQHLPPPTSSSSTSVSTTTTTLSGTTTTSATTSTTTDSTTTTASASESTTTSASDPGASASDSVSTAPTNSAPPAQSSSTSATSPTTIVVPPSPSDTVGSSSSSDSSGSASTAAPDDGGVGATPIGSTSIPVSEAPPPSTTTTPESPQGQSGTAANDGAPTSTSSPAPVIPGKKLEVLPIGLGVFAGISVIALIVVGLVTYERTKYRKAFRQRRLAASGAEMGYGGMSERR